MKLVPLRQWVCDTCGERIERAEDGWVEWFSTWDVYKTFGFRIVHHNQRCQYEGPLHLMDAHLQDFVGSDGLVKLLAILTPGKDRDPDERFGAKDPDEWCELVRRLQVPNYEEARLYWSLAEQQGDFWGANEVSPYLHSSLQWVIDRYRDK